MRYVYILNFRNKAFIEDSYQGSDKPKYVKHILVRLENNGVEDYLLLISDGKDEYIVPFIDLLDPFVH